MYAHTSQSTVQGAQSLEERPLPDLEQRRIGSDPRARAARRHDAQKRLPGAERKAQIAQATLQLATEHGLHGVSLSRIAAAVGISNAALYRHFKSRDDILIAAYDLLDERVHHWIGSAEASNAMQRLRQLCKSHASVFSVDLEGFNAPMFQFIAWIPRDRVREHVDVRHQAVLDAFVQILEQGKAQGVVRADLDSELAVSELYAWIWWEDLSYLAGLDPDSTRKRSAEMYGRLLRDIAAPSGS
jgi:AcrR family transcriptional regulator